MKNTYYPQKFEDSKGNIVTKYVWSQDIDNEIWPKDAEGYTMMPYYEQIQQAPRVGKMSVSQIQADRKQRSSQHFKKDILPTLGSDEQTHFKNKYKS